MTFSYSGLTARSRAKLKQISIAICITATTLYYIWPALDYSHQLVGTHGDALAHPWYAEWMCHHFYRYQLHLDTLYHPIGIDMANSYEMPLPNLIGCLASSQGAIAIFNLIAITQLITIFLTSWLIACKYLKSSRLRIAFTLLYSFSPFVLARQQTHINLLSTAWAASLIVYLFHRLDLTNRRRTIIAFLGYAIAVVSAWQNIANLTGLVAIFLLQSLWQHRTQLKRSAINICIASSLACLATLPLSGPMIWSVLDDGLAIKNTSLLTFNSLGSYLMPWQHHYLYDLLNAFNIPYPTIPHTEKAFGIDPMITLLTVTLITIVGIRRQKPKTPLLLTLGIIYLILPLKQDLTIGEHLIRVAPFEAVFTFPPFSLTRVPSRVGIVGVLLVTIWTLQQFEFFMYKSKHRLTGPILTSISIYAFFTTTVLSKNTQINTLRLRNIADLPALEQIRSDPSTSTVLNLPYEPSQMQNFLQLFHGKNIITGYVSYATDTSQPLELIQDDPALSLLDCDEDLELTDTFGQQQAIHRFENLFIQSLAQKDIGYVIVDSQVFDHLPACDTYRRWATETISTYKYLQLLSDQNGVQIYKVDPLPEHADSVFITHTPTPIIGESLLLPNSTFVIDVLSEGNSILDYSLMFNSEQPQSVEIKTDTSQQTHTVSGESAISDSLKLIPGHNMIEINRHDCLGKLAETCPALQLKPTFTIFSEQ